ncbi:TylF/MycF/NovP-related O-methyltransferase [Microlunatus soli]|uniref:Macrocin-O-methyltransferase (TylF) n=1 Tax=Microlunatus soli TaxID=630515 RepID=A0A1H2AN12_9ACTN|nr:TylF/MycF/NovP-related O-methyltransferase [Microlunatus soli]SDT47323.1 Macrocin-O-methyltransferase (TylF) [Microlunatus soli]
MRNLIWQYHIDTKRSYDGVHRKRMAMASSETVAFYAMKYGVEYEMASHSRWWKNGYHGGPAMERFQLLDERFDVYDQILYIDTDILVSPDAPNIFDEYADATIAGLHQTHRRDITLLQEGWLRTEFPDPARYRASYVNGAILVMSRDFRQYLRGVLRVEDIQVDKGTHWDRDGINVRWPVYDQSMVSYWLAMSPFDLTSLDRAWFKGPHFYNHGGPKTDESLHRYFSRYDTLREQWIPRGYPGTTTGDPHPETAHAAEIASAAETTGTAETKELKKAPAKPTVENLSKQVRQKRLSYLGQGKFDSIYDRIEQIRSDGVAGDFTEFGVALGGSGICLARALEDGQRYFGFDVFGMIPPPSQADGQKVLNRYKTISSGESKGISGDPYYGYMDDLLEKVKGNFAEFDCPVDGRRINLVEGLFETTLPAHDDLTISLAHIDCDWYDPVKLCLEYAWGHLSPGGFIILDDYNSWPGCKKAADEFLAATPAAKLLYEKPNAVIRKPL